MYVYKYDNVCKYDYVCTCECAYELMHMYMYVYIMCVYANYQPVNARFCQFFQLTLIKMPQATH